MKELVVISGKGGTGKTSITAAFASLAQNAVLADCDVDASDLPLILKPQVLKTEDCLGLELASIDLKLCTGCGVCREICKQNIHFGGRSTGWQDSKPPSRSR